MRGKVGRFGAHVRQKCYIDMACKWHLSEGFGLACSLQYPPFETASGRVNKVRNSASQTPTRSVLKGAIYMQSVNDTRLSQQWMSRPDDQRFLTLDALADSVNARAQRSREVTIASDALRIVHTSDDDIQLVGPDGGKAELTHWSMGQLARLGGAPVDYLRTLPPVLAAPALAWSLEQRAEKGEAAKVLVSRREDGGVEARAITSATYGRIWDREVVAAIRRLGPDWHVPAASYSGKDPLRATTLYASDRDVFIFLCRQEVVEVGGTVLNRGVMAWNSETGARSFGLATFTYDRVCDNRIIWGVKDSKEIRIRHTSGAPTRLVAEVLPVIRAYVQADTRQIAATVNAARDCEVGRDRESVEAWMAKRGFTKAQAREAYAFAERDERNQGLNPRTVWGLVQGVTDYAHGIAHTDTRTALERQAGELLETVAA